MVADITTICLREAEEPLGLALGAARLSAHHASSRSRSIVRMCASSTTMCVGSAGSLSSARYERRYPGVTKTTSVSGVKAAVPEKA
jgi:hypothetical protein